MDNEDILRQLNEDEVDELLQLYLNKYGLEHFHYLLLYNQRKWDKQLQSAGIADTDPAYISMRKRFFTHRRGDFRQHGTYVSLHYDLHQSVSFFSWQPDEPRELFECLEQTQRIEWQLGALLTNVDLSFCERVKALALERGASAIQNARSCYGMVLPHKQALAAHVPELGPDFELRVLNEQDADLVHAVWPNKREGSLPYIKALIRFNKTLGVCRSDTGELVAWIFQNDFSGLGLLQVLPKVERRGLGGYLATKMTARIARGEQVTLTAWIVRSNFRSDALLNRIGYKKAVVNEWIKLAPVT